MRFLCCCCRSICERAQKFIEHSRNVSVIACVCICRLSYKAEKPHWKTTKSTIWIILCPEDDSAFVFFIVSSMKSLEQSTKVTMRRRQYIYCKWMLSMVCAVVKSKWNKKSTSIIILTTKLNIGSKNNVNNDKKNLW